MTSAAMVRARARHMSNSYCTLYEVCKSHPVNTVDWLRKPAEWNREMEDLDAFHGSGMRCGISSCLHQWREEKGYWKYTTS